MPLKTNHLKPLARPLLLDAVPGAAAAYSLRQLGNAYTGPVVTVRRSSDNAEADFKASEINDGSLAAFCGAGDGFVKTWFDQSGNGNDASQTTAASQPKIVSSGSLVTEGGKAALEFDGSNDRLVATGYKPSGLVGLFSLFTYSSLTSADTPFSFHKVAAPSGGVALFNYTPGPTKISLNTGLGGTWVDGVNEFAIGDFDLSQSLICIQIATSTTTLHYRGVQLLNANKGAVAVGNDLIIGGNANTPGSSPFDGNFQELIIYPSDQSANRQRIEGDIAWYY